MQKGQGLGVPPDKDVFFGMDAATLTAITLAGVIGLVGIILWRYLSPPPSSSSGRKQTPTRLPQSNSRDTIKAHKPDPWTPDTEAEDLLATASEDEQKKLRPLITSLAPTSDHNAQIKAARAALFYVQDEAQWDLMRRAGVLSAMARLVVATASRAAERGEGPPREAAAVLAALAPALARLARAPELREALATPALVQHVIYLLHSPTLVEPTKAALVALLNLFVRLGPNTPPMRAAMADYRLGPTLAQLFLEATTESGEALIKHTANAVVPFIGAEEESATAEALLQHGGVEHALQLFETGRTAFAKRRTPLALVSLLGALSRVANAETCEQVLSRSLAEYMIAELRKNQKPAFRQHLPELLGLLRALLLQPDERPGPPRAHLDAARRRFQDFFLDEREDDGTTGLEQIMSFLRDPKVFADAAEVLLDLSLANERIVAGIKANEEAMKHIRAAAEDEAHPGNEPASLLLARLGSTAAAQ